MIKSNQTLTLAMKGKKPEAKGSQYLKPPIHHRDIQTTTPMVTISIG
jgi:hypothetical protein